MSATEATLLLNAAAAGDKTAADRLLPLIYDQLRRAAQLQMAAERPDHTLSATALVHEAYLKLIGPREIAWADRRHFYAAAAEAMRRILLDHARARARLKHGGGEGFVHGGSLADFENLAELTAREPAERLSFDDALRRLESEAPESAAVVRLRFFAGLTIVQTAEALGVSDRTVDRLWLYARAWLRRELRSAVE
jgi:RNA polymerase sigma factor (TIGR02999 family)